MKVADLIARRQPPKKPSISITDELTREMEALEPGRVLTIMSKRGRTFVILELEDFEHIAAVGGMELASPTGEKHD